MDVKYFNKICNKVMKELCDRNEVQFNENEKLLFAHGFAEGMRFVLSNQKERIKRGV